MLQHAFKEAARVLGESMVKYWNEHEDDSALSPLRAMNISSSDALVCVLKTITIRPIHVNCPVLKNLENPITSV
jgi:hypothetical protein